IITTFVVTILAAILAIGLGSVHISVPDMISTLINGRDQEGVYTTIIWDIRLPRVLLALIIVASIAISGALMQAVMG
ncbi:iron chelate uptake ABC transporter family permease subunit, partial [Bacillus paralicheniformis]|uniref:iron chelate uptake ABC transporter family permease subunit n=1 Tax=Bacillus paralicheniformis TaxID=1648923 RepID=UPI0024BDF651